MQRLEGRYAEAGERVCRGWRAGVHAHVLLARALRDGGVKPGARSGARPDGQVGRVRGRQRAAAGRRRARRRVLRRRRGPERGRRALARGVLRGLHLPRRHSLRGTCAAVAFQSCTVPRAQ